MGERAYVDANVLLRVLTNDPPEMVEQARKLLGRVSRGEVTLVLDPLVIAEMVWVLSSYYKVPRRQLGTTLLEMCETEGFEVKEKGVVVQALRNYVQTSVDFIDAYLAARCNAEACPVYSFDRDHFAKLATKWLPPE
ncbi:PIN domain-containing protein [Thermaerobacter litoralis]